MSSSCATQVVDDVRRRVQQDTTGHRGRRGDPPYRIRNILRAGQEHLTDRQRARLQAAFTAREAHVEVEVAWRCAQLVGSAYHQVSHAAGRAVAEKILASFSTCPIPEVAQLGRTLKQWRSEFLGYFDTGGANNSGTEAVNGLLEGPPPHRPRLPQPRQLPPADAAHRGPPDDVITLNGEEPSRPPSAYSSRSQSSEPRPRPSQA